MRHIVDEISIPGPDGTHVILSITPGGTDPNTPPEEPPHLILDIEMLYPDDLTLPITPQLRVSHGHATAIVLALSGALKHARDAAHDRGWTIANG